MPFSEETRRKISEAKLGHPVSPETRAKISAKLTGRKNGPPSAETRARIAAAESGEKAPWWAGDRVGYGGIHKRARAELTNKCFLADSSCSGQLDPRGTHSIQVSDYVRLCRSHHIRYDRRSLALERS